MLKKFTSIAICFIILISATPVLNFLALAQNETYEQSDNGSIAITTSKELFDIRNNPSEKYYLANDIIFSEDDFQESGEFYNNGAGWLPIDSFLGVFDGNNHKISGLKISLDGSDSSAGLFLNNSGVIKNIKVQINLNVTFRKRTYNNLLAYGAVCAVNTGIITNSSSSGSMNFKQLTLDDAPSLRGLYIGGITGKSDGSYPITFCSNSVNISLEAINNIDPTKIQLRLVV